MGGLDLLGTAAVDAADLARLLGGEQVSDVRVEVLDYDLATMTTGGRWSVSGTLDGAGFRVVVKVARSVRRSPIMAFIPPEAHAVAEANLPWHIEPAVYRSRLAEHVPAGTRLPRCAAVVDLDDESAAMWLEAVDHDTGRWSDEDYAAAARAFGALAAASPVQQVADEVGHPSGPRQARTYWEGRLSSQYVPAYRDEGLWRHPVLAAHAAAGWQGRLARALEAVPALLDEIEELPLLAAHGDACPNNVLRTHDGLVLIDWSFFGRGRLGFDLSQLVTSEIDLGRDPATVLPRRQDVCLEAYRAGLAVGGVQVSEEQLRRAHEVQVLLAWGVAAVPLDRLDDPPATLAPLVAERLTALDHVLTALDL